MGGCVAIQPLQLLGVIQQAGHDLLARGLAQARLIRAGLGDADGFHPLDRDHLGQAVHLAKGQLQHASHVAHRRLGQQRAEGDDLAHLVGAIFALHIADHLLAAVHAEIDVEIRHADPLRVQEALEQQVIAQRVQVGDGQRIGDQRPGPRPAPRTDRDALFLGPMDEIGHDQEIAGKAHLFDDAQFEIQAGGVFLGRDRMGDDLQALGQTGMGLTAQFGHLVIGEFGQDRRVLGHRKGAAAGDFDGIVDRLGQVGEQDGHLLGRFEVMLGRQAAAGVGLVDIGLFRDADQSVMRLVHRRLGEIDVVRRHQRQVPRIGQIDQPALGRGLGGHQLAILAGMALQFHIQAVAKGRGQPVGQRLGLGHLPLRDQQAQRTDSAPCQADQPLGPPAQLIDGHMRQRAALAQGQAGGQRHKVHPARLVLRQEDHRPRGIRRQRHLTADDGLDALVAGLHAEFQRGEHVVRIGQRHRRHARISGKSGQFAYGNGTFQQRMLGMCAKMDESGGFCGHDRGCIAA